MAGVCFRVIAAVVAGFLIAADEPPKPAKPSSTLFLVVRAGPGLSATLIRDTLTRGLSKAKCHVEGEPTVKPVPAAIYDELNSSLNNATTPRAAATGRLQIGTLPSREPLWELRLANNRELLLKLAVTYRDAGTNEYIPGAKSDLNLLTPGQYTLRTQANDVPLRFEAKILELGKGERIEKGDWPAFDIYFLVTLRQFQGDREALFKTIQDPAEVPNPLSEIEVKQDLAFVFASLNASASRVGDIIDRNEFVPQVPGPNPGRAKRVWMLFPLTENQMQQQLAAYRKYGEREVVEAIRKGEGGQPTWAATVVKLSAETQPAWLELSDQGDGKLFSRRLPIEDAPKLRAKFPRVWRLLVWEFDDGQTPPGAIAVQGPQGGRLYVVGEEVKQWAASR